MTKANSSHAIESTRGSGKLAQWFALWGLRQRRAADELFPPRIDALTGRPASRPFHTPYH
jgi:hypothetical protein